MRDQVRESFKKMLEEHAEVLRMLAENDGPRMGSGTRELYDRIIREFSVVLYDILSEYHTLGDDLGQNDQISFDLPGI